MGLFDKLNDQLEVNNIRAREITECELKKIENKLIFEGYHINILEDGDKWDNFKTLYGNKLYNDNGKKIDYPWKNKKEEEAKREREQKEIADKAAKEKKENDDKAAKEKEESLKKLQTEYDYEFEMINRRIRRAYNDFFEDKKTIEASTSIANKMDEIKKIRTTAQSNMSKFENQLKELNKDPRYKEITRQKINYAALDLEEDAYK